MKSFLSNRSSEAVPSSLTSPKSDVPAGLSLIASKSASLASQCSGQSASVVTCKKDGDLIRTIIVTCSCGKVTEIDCSYTGSKI